MKPFNLITLNDKLLNQTTKRNKTTDIKLIWVGCTRPLQKCKTKAMLENQVASYFDGPLPWKINLISCELIVHISDIKLIRTDTTLDLSQKAEKGMIWKLEVFKFYIPTFNCLPVFWQVWDFLTWVWCFQHHYLVSSFKI